MNYGVQYLTDSERKALQVAYNEHGRDAYFWQTYKDLEEVARARTGDSRIKVANEMARAAAKIGANERPLYL
ncbi:hypothetical protein [Stenotrophomonas acidaminiphila]|uniref:hypothetical protein n=1 Tax=Stenotrophomonas acidaminiphila TaxID=128780 RepID=UPI0024ADFD19|nr:hypothetical protein [Stenotrophomonas acidaminiphila]WHL17619.1 hypothetical protein QLF99_11110 [Stenotrophomonas acidaminiphila]